MKSVANLLATRTGSLALVLFSKLVISLLPLVSLRKAEDRVMEMMGWSLHSDPTYFLCPSQRESLHQKLVAVKLVWGGRKGLRATGAGGL